ncbi:enoyl-CoA hydratase/isomerase family protein [Frigoribacterium sp. UYMn621]|uniref:enoyl-CoA hydratase/isomerase family protein n=1 Tax=Frigoribacterium sp. UYMn621 TaxID=3156343 RepID=UPI00339318F8
MKQAKSIGSRVRLVQDGGRWDIVLSSPDRRNALDLQATGELRDAVREVAAHGDDVSVVVLRAEGTNFSVGGDLKEFAAHQRDATEHLRATVEPLHEAVMLLASFPCPVVTVAQGAIAGAGIGLAYSGDVVVLADDAVSRLAYTAVGLSPDGGASYLLPRALGERLAIDLLLTNRSFTASEALAWGLASRVVPAAELRAETDRVVAALLEVSSESLAATKRLAKQSMPLAEQLNAEAESITNLIATRAAQTLIQSFGQR